MQKKNKAVIIGGGLMGVATFYVLARRGLEPMLLEAGPGLANGTSFANGGMLTPSMPEPWNSPGVGKHLASSLFNPNSAMKLRWTVLPLMVPWGLKFLLNSTRARHSKAIISNFALADHSVDLTWKTIREHGLNCDGVSAGALKIFGSQDAMQEALATAALLKPHGLMSEAVSCDEAVAIEPELDATKHRIAGAIFYKADGVADAYKFVQALALVAEQYGGRIETSKSVIAVDCRGGEIRGVQTVTDYIPAGDVVIAAGTATNSLIRKLGVRLSIKPAKGYSVTLNADKWSSRPQIPVIDDSMHAAVSPLGRRLRVAGTAEFAGNDLRLNQGRVENLYKVFSRLYPELASQVDRSLCSAWTGLRPMSSDGVPFIGPAGPKGLWINAGHGHLGWTMAMGSADLIGSLITGDRVPIDPRAYRADR